MGEIGINLPSKQDEGLVLVEQILETNFIVHNSLQAFNALMVDLVTLGFTEIRML